MNKKTQTEIVDDLQKLRKENPNNFTFGTKARLYLEKLKQGKKYTEPKVSL